MKNILSFSGGKDSTALLLMMIERDIPIDEIIHFSMGNWEWPQMNRHIEKVQNFIGEKINFTVLTTEKNKNDFIKKKGFPNMFLRWCTTFKQQTINQYLKKNYPESDYTQYIGIAFDEKERVDRKYAQKIIVKYPLVDWEITEKMALDYCYEHGFDWEGLYEELPGKRVSCWCCPLQTTNDLRNLYANHYDLWEKLREMQNLSYQSFRLGNNSVFLLEHRFWFEKFSGERQKMIDNNKRKEKQLEMFKK